MHRVFVVYSSLRRTDRNAYVRRVGTDIRWVWIVRGYWFLPRAMTIAGIVHFLRERPTALTEQLRVPRLTGSLLTLVGIRSYWLLPSFSGVCAHEQASGSQRAGRAGRVRPGKCWRLYPQAFYDGYMPPHTLAEMLRTPLEELVLQVRTRYHESMWGG